MKQFLKHFVIISAIQFFILVIIVILVAVVASQPPKVDENSVLTLKIKGSLPESLGDDYVKLIMGEKDVSFKDVLDNIDKAKVDDRINGIYLEIGGLSMGWAKVEELQNKLFEFRESGKWISGYMVFGGEKEYYLSLVCNDVYMPPTGMLVLNGFQARVLFLKGTLEKLGIEPEVERVGEYKTAADLFERETMSDAQREVLNALLDERYEQLITSIVDYRNITREEVIALIDEYGIFEPEDAVQHQLIDGQKYEDEMLAYLRQKNGDDDELTSITSNEYALIDAQSLDLNKGKKIALIYGVGTISSGDDDHDPVMGRVMGSDDAIRLIRKVRENDDYAALIYRIDSPGGSGVASDLIWRELIITKEKKPVIASMSDVAASGGYYIAMCADSIIAQPGTITGSIGVVGAKFNMEDAYEDKLGMNFESIQRGKYAAIFDNSKPFSDDERRKFEEMIHDFYQDFVQKAADGRGMSWGELHEIAQGRVWTGSQAYERGLVDALGGFDRAVLAAKRKLGLSDSESVQIVTLTKEPKFVTEVMRELDIHLQTKFEEKIVSPEIKQSISPVLESFLFEPYDILALMPYTVIIE